MNRFAWLLILVGAVVFGAVWYFAGGARETPPVTAEVGGSPEVPVAAAGAATEVGPAASPAISEDQAQRWIREAHGPDPRQRAAAIQALAKAPRAQALPALHQILINGEPMTDRPLALGSLRELALSQGDADGKVREAIREAIYHSDDQNPTLMADAQSALNDVENSELR